MKTLKIIAFLACQEKFEFQQNLGAVEVGAGKKGQLILLGNGNPFCCYSHTNILQAVSDCQRDSWKIPLHHGFDEGDFFSISNCNA